MLRHEKTEAAFVLVCCAMFLPYAFGLEALPTANVDLVRNGGFERIDKESAGVVGWALGSDVVPMESHAAHGGQSVLKFETTDRSTLRTAFGLSAPFPVVPRRTYTVRLATRIERLRVRGRPFSALLGEIVWLGESLRPLPNARAMGAMTTPFVDCTKPSEDWITPSTQVKVPKTAHYARIRLVVRNAACRVFVDDVAFVDEVKATVAFRPLPLDDHSLDVLPGLDVGRCPKPPLIDGRLNESGWNAAGLVRIQSSLSDGPGETKVLVVRDNEALYFAFVFDHPPVRPPRAEAADLQKSETAEGDYAEIVVCVGARLDRRFCFTIDSLGVARQVGARPTASAVRVVAAATRTERRWSAEARVPFAAMRLRPPKKTSLWWVCLKRRRGSQRELGALARPNVPIHSRSRFWRMRFVERPTHPSVVAVALNGVVRDGSGPAPGLRVVADHTATYTDNYGRFALSGLPPGTIRLYFLGEKHVPLVGTIEATARRCTVVPPRLKERKPPRPPTTPSAQKGTTRQAPPRRGPSDSSQSAPRHNR